MTTRDELKRPTAEALRMLVAELAETAQYRGLGPELAVYRDLHARFRKVANRFEPHPSTCDHEYGLTEWMGVPCAYPAAVIRSCFVCDHREKVSDVDDATYAVWETAPVDERLPDYYRARDMWMHARRAEREAAATP